MSTETWGLLPKSQIDSTLIEDRVAQMIAEHNDDPTAHMADDQSIGIHRINDVLDHPVGSTLADKWTMSEMEFTTTFDNLTLFVTTGHVTQLWPGVNIHTHGTSVPHLSKVSVDGETNLLNFNTGLEFLAQFVCYVDQVTSEQCRFIYGGSSGSGWALGFFLGLLGLIIALAAGEPKTKEGAINGFVSQIIVALFIWFVIGCSRT